MGHTDQETTLALIIVTISIIVIAILCCVFKDIYAFLTCPLRCIGSTYKRCCPASTGYRTEGV